MNIINENNLLKELNLENNKKKNYYKKFLFLFLIIILYFTLILNLFFKKNKTQNVLKEINLKKEKIKGGKKKNYISPLQRMLIYESKMPHLNEILKKRIFENRIPLPKEIKCHPHLRNRELTAFLSLLTNDTIFFETGSGCSSVIAKYFAKKTYAVEGCKKYYEIGIKNGLKDNLIFKDLKTDNPTWSRPGRKSNINDWKKYFQSYKKEYNADIILIDGRFKTATAMDIFDKIRDDTIVLIHEYYTRPIYFEIEKYYNYVYHWDSLFAFVKKKNIKKIPLEIQKKYWDQFL